MQRTEIVAKCPGCYQRFSQNQEGLIIGPSHALGCRGEGALALARYNKLRNLVAEILQKHLPLNGVETTIEQTLTAPHGVHAEPSSVGYMGRGSLEDADGLRAADQRAAEKIRLFQKDITAVDLALYVPFMIDSSERLGNCALEFLLRSKMPGRIQIKRTDIY